MHGKLTMTVSREHICNGDDEQIRRDLAYNEHEMLSQFLKSKVTEYLPYTRGLTIWAIYMDSDVDMDTPLREDPNKKIAFIHKNEDCCVKCEIKGGDRLVKSLGTGSMYCAIYR